MSARRTQSSLTKAFAASTRKPKAPAKVTRPFSIRLSDTERQALEEAAGNVPIGTFVRARVLATPLLRKRVRRPASDTVALGKILGTLGRSGVASGLMALGVAEEQGTIALTPDLEAELRVAIADVREVRRLLFQALGVRGLADDP